MRELERKKNEAKIAKAKSNILEYEVVILERQADIERLKKSIEQQRNVINTLEGELKNG